MSTPSNRTLPDSDAPKLSIVAMFTHDASLARACLGSVARVAGEGGAAETLVVLSDAADDVRRVVLVEFSGARVIDSPINTGTAVGWQLAFNAARGARVLLLHEDAELAPGALQQLLATLEREPSAAAVGPWLAESGPQRGDINAGWLRFGDRGLRITPAQLPARLGEAPYAVDEISSAVSLWRRTAWEQIGGFEERTYPAISVEADSFAALWARGWSVLVEPRVTCPHRTGTMNVAPTLLSGPHIRHFLGRRFEMLWREKWAGRIDWLIDPQQHGWNDWPPPQEAINLALEAAQQRRQTPLSLADPPRSEQWISNPDRLMPPPTAVDAAMAQRLADAQRSVIDDYTRWLIERDIEMTTRYEEAYAAYLAEARESERLRAELSSAGGAVDRRGSGLRAALRRIVPRR